MTSYDWPVTPTEVRQQTRNALSADDPEEPQTTTLELLDCLGTTAPINRAITANIHSLADADPTVTPIVVSRLAEKIAAELDKSGPYLSGAAIDLFFDLIKQHPSTVETCTETLRRLDRLGTIDTRIDELLAIVGQSQPEMLAELMDIVTHDDSAGSIRRVRGWALAGAVRLNAEPFTDAVNTLKNVLRDGSANDQAEAASRIGGIGLVAPSVARPTIPLLITAAASPDDAVRTAAIDALGRVAGTIQSFESRFGHPSEELAPDVFETLKAALWTDDSQAAARALARASAHDSARADRAVQSVCARLESADNDETIQTLLSALTQLVPGTAHDELVVDRCLGVANTTMDAKTLESAYIVLEAAADNAGQFSGATRLAVSDMLRTAISNPESPGTDSAIEAAGAWLEADSPAPDGLSDALLARLADDESPREALVSSLTAVSPTPLVREYLRVAFTQRSTNEAAAEVLYKYDDDQLTTALVTTLIEDCVTAFRNGQYHDRPEKIGLLDKDYHLSDEQRALAEAVERVADDNPEVVAPHAETLANLVTDEAVSPSVQLFRALEQIIKIDPSAIKPTREALRTKLDSDDLSKLEAAPLVAIIAASESGDSVDLESLLTQYRVPDLGEAFDTLGESTPHLALQAVPVFSARLQADDSHENIGAWLHQLPSLVQTDARFALVIPDCIKPAFQATDNWVRRDAADIFAAINPNQSVFSRRFRPLLEGALYDSDTKVTPRVLNALAVVGETESEPNVDYAMAHPQSFVKDAATDARTVLHRDDSLHYKDDYNGASVDAEVRQRQVAERLGLAIDESASERSLAALDSLAAVNNDRPVLARLLSDPDPVVRALAASAVPALPVDDKEMRAAVMELLVDAATDDNVLCRRWAVDALGRFGQRYPETAERAVSVLTEHLPMASGATKTVFVGALARLGETSPTALIPALKPLLDCCNSSSPTCRLLAAEALTYVEPAELASVPGAAETALRLTESDRPRLGRFGNTLLLKLAIADPETLTGHIDAFVGDDVSTKPLALVAATYPQAVRPYEDTIADMRNSPVVRRTLACIHSSAYPDLLAERFESPETEPFPTITSDNVGLTSGPSEFDTFIRFLISVPDPDDRSAALDCLHKGPTNGRLLTATLQELRTRCVADDKAVRRGALASVKALLERCEQGNIDRELATSLLSACQERANADSWAERSDALNGIVTLLATWSNAVEDPQTLCETLLTALEDDYEWPRRHAARALGHLPAATLLSNDVPAAIRSLTNGDRTAQRGAALAVGYVVPTGALSLSDGFDILDPLMTAPDRWVRQQTVESAVRIAQGVEQTAREQATGRAWRILEHGLPK